eukprot:CAMPEP_0117466816 /NCGR_PEP_ID=MMETSP0784-20121206/5336_1 /TAXON_ID=39447 /ORGANISM="" /LENGTH=288 /DNA_ID=CAMNT_0005260767 /DNA_START=28 /DNA_END=892 /DNA_ORIENTATION=-
MQQEMNQAIHDVTTKDNEKFDLIFSILMELQRRQAQLEESVRGLKAQIVPPTENSAQQGGFQQPSQGQQQQQGHQQGQPQGQQNGQQFGDGSHMGDSVGSNGQQFGQMGGQVGSPMGQQMGGYIMGGQQMGQQFGGMIAADGSHMAQTYFTPGAVVVAMPGGAGQMPYVPQVISPAGAMHAMLTQMVQYCGQEQSGGGAGDGQPWANGRSHGQQQWSNGPAASCGGAAANGGVDGRLLHDGPVALPAPAAPHDDGGDVRCAVEQNAQQTPEDATPLQAIKASRASRND